MPEATVSLDEFKTLMADLLDQKLASKKALESEAKNVLPTMDEKEKSKKLDGVERELKFWKAVFTHDNAQAKALSEGTDTAGGYLVPEEFYSRIIEKRKSILALRNFVSVLPMSSDTTNAGTEDGTISVYWPAENAAATASDPSFGNAQLTAHLMTILVKSSRQLLDDAKPSVLDYLARIFTREATREEDRVIITGSGSGQPTGMRTAITTAAQDFAGTTNYDNVVKLVYSLPAGYRQGAIFMGSSLAAQALLLAKDSNGRPIFNPQPDERGLKNLLGYPFYETDHIPQDLGTGSDATELWFFNPEYYIMGDREQFSTEASTQAGDAFAKHQLWLKGYERIAGNISQAEAFVFASNVK